MNDFKGRHFEGEVVVWAVRWYCRYPISYRDVESMMTERGVAVDHSIRINRQWRLCFEWRDGEAGPSNVEIVDYHG